MAGACSSCSTGQQVIISLRDLSHEVCVAATQASYWQQLVQHSSISITSHGKYVPVELNSICSDEDEPRLHLIIQSQHEQDAVQLHNVCDRIHYDLPSFKINDRPIHDSNNRQVIVYGSLYNSLPSEVFETERHLLGQRNCNIKRIRNTLGCSIDVDKSTPQRYRFTIRHENHSVMDLALIQIQALVIQAQQQYIIAFATKIGRSLVGPIEPIVKMETGASSSNPYGFPSFTPFQPLNKRKREDDEEKPTISSPMINDSDESEDEIPSDETRQQRRLEMEALLNGIYKRMHDRTPIDDVAKAREDSSQIKSYFRKSNASKTITQDLELSIELVEHEIDLRTRGLTDHKCTLVFNKQLKMGSGVCDRLKRTAKVRAYKQLVTMTRDTPRENLIVRQTRDGMWKAVIKPTNN